MFERKTSTYLFNYYRYFMCFITFFGTHYKIFELNIFSIFYLSFSNKITEMETIKKDSYLHSVVLQCVLVINNQIRKLLEISEYCLWR